ncbi:hypothetical protein [Amycolatopsis regifaucium]|uniref:hypothetical protein n=1 Tax=Amycolatopsis regifaucium TaxID=546365 RepID=UPI001300E1CA|nr:hypothetical protein [Amycolatopsis regifaucium]
MFAVWTVVAGLSLLVLLTSPGAIVPHATLGATVAPTAGLAVALIMVITTRDATPESDGTDA